MTATLRKHIINMKSLDQDIKDPIVAAAGTANGRTLSIIFTQEAAAQFSDSTQVYLAWKHQELKTRGYNVFTKVNDNPNTWEINYPMKLLREGHVIARIELADEISVAASTDFIINVLEDPLQGDNWLAESDDLDDIREVAKYIKDSHQIIDYDDDDLDQKINTTKQYDIIDWTGGEE